MRSQLRLNVIAPLAVVALVGLAVAAFAFTGAPKSEEPAAVVKQQVKPQAPETDEGAKPKKPVRTKLERKLAKNPVVVVVLYAPGSAVDAMATREARAGALDAGVGFLAVDVTKPDAVAALATHFGVREAPALLVFQRGLKIATKIDGFADRETVAQAAENALL